MKQSKKIAQLEQDYAKVNQQLASFQERQKFPALEVEIVELFNQFGKVKHTKNLEDEEFFREETEVSVFASTAKTGVEWLDQLLLNSLIGAKSLTQPITEKEAMAYFQQRYQQLETEAKEVKPIGLSDTVHTTYIGQRNNIATFTQFFEQYTGGAHGTHYTKYVNVDTNKKAVIGINDLVNSEHHEKLKAILWQRYQQRGDAWSDSMDKNEMTIPNEFYFTLGGITFVYPIYQLGPYVAGEVEIETSFYELEPILNPDYFPTKKEDGN